MKNKFDEFLDPDYEGWEWGLDEDSYFDKENYLLTFFLLSQMNEKAVNAFFQQKSNVDDEFLFNKAEDWLSEIGYVYRSWKESKSENIPDIKAKMMEILAESLGITDYFTEPVLPEEDYVEWIMKANNADNDLLEKVYRFLKSHNAIGINEILIAQIGMYNEIKIPEIYLYLDCELVSNHGHFAGLIQETFKNQYKEREFIKNGQKVKGKDIFTRKWKCGLHVDDIDEVLINPEIEPDDPDVCCSYSGNLWENLEKCLLNDFDVKFA